MAEEDGVIEITLKIEGKFLVNFSVTVECSPVSAGTHKSVHLIVHACTYWLSVDIYVDYVRMIGF